MKLREYQEKFKADIYSSLRLNPSVMCQLPTGGGKTVVFLSIASDGVKNGKTVLIVVDRIELIKQTAQKALSLFGINADIIQAGRSDWKRANIFSGGAGRLIIASQQTINNRDLPEADLLIFDEAHLAIALTYRRTIEHYLSSGAKVLGFSATPWNTKGAGYEDLFNAIVSGPDVAEMIKTGFLNDYELVFRKLDADLTTVKMVAGDYGEGQLFNLYDKPKIYGDIYSTWSENARDRKTLIFCVNVEHSKKTAAFFAEQGVSALHLDGASDKKERARVMDWFRKGNIQVLTNCNLFSYGLDVPDCDCVVVARATSSLVYFLQACGRGLRVAKGKKKTVLIDHGDNVVRHGLPDDPREWSLKPRVKKRRKKTDAESFDFILDVEIKKKLQRKFKHEGAEFMKLTQSEREELRNLIAEGMKKPKVYTTYDLPDPKTHTLEDILNAAEELPLKTNSGKVNYLAAFGVYRSANSITIEDVETVRTRAGYKSGWVDKACELYGVARV